MNEFIIIGAGPSGVLLANHFKDSIILEKSRGVGGRLASRRLGGFSLNHGPQEVLINNKLITDPHKWIKEQASGLTILNNWEVSHLEVENERVKIFGTANQYLECKKVILTCPAPQTKLILERSNLTAEFLGDVKYKSVVQFMMLSSNSIKTDQLEKIFENKHRILLPEYQSLQLYEVKQEFLNQFLEMDKEQIKSFCQSQVEGNILDSHAHKWRYSEVTDPISSKYQFNFAKKNIFLAGDYFGTEGVQSSIEAVKFMTLASQFD